MTCSKCGNFYVSQKCPHCNPSNEGQLKSLHAFHNKAYPIHQTQPRRLKTFIVSSIILVVLSILSGVGYITFQQYQMKQIYKAELIRKQKAEEDLKRAKEDLKKAEALELASRKRHEAKEKEKERIRRLAEGSQQWLEQKRQQKLEQERQQKLEQERQQKLAQSVKKSTIEPEIKTKTMTIKNTNTNRNALDTHIADNEGMRRLINSPRQHYQIQKYSDYIKLDSGMHMWQESNGLYKSNHQIYGRTNEEVEPPMCTGEFNKELKINLECIPLSAPHFRIFRSPSDNSA